MNDENQPRVTSQMLKSVFQENVRNNQLGGMTDSHTDGISADVAYDLGFKSPEETTQIINTQIAKNLGNKATKPVVGQPEVIADEPIEPVDEEVPVGMPEDLRAQMDARKAQIELEQPERSQLERLIGHIQDRDGYQ